VSQQQLRDPVPGTHQITADVLAGTDQVTSGFLGLCRDPDLSEVVVAQQPGQQLRVAGVGLDRSPEGRFSFDGAATTHRMPLAVIERHKPNPVGPAS
jgi:hypothetical protein